MFIAGVTGSGKGGVVQIIALAAHLGGMALVNADPKGSSSPDVETKSVTPTTLLAVAAINAGTRLFWAARTPPPKRRTRVSTPTFHPEIPERNLVVLIGPGGAGKPTHAGTWPASQVLSWTRCAR
ncbi:hypothetical protein ACFWPV_16565 [Streptomyces uncialis]|uniref:hypothetical protein n=1 Tax=Streptomyces uncialis TaxID=1048205 RepID=UPI0036473810